MKRSGEVGRDSTQESSTPSQSSRIGPTLHNFDNQSVSQCVREQVRWCVILVLLHTK